MSSRGCSALDYQGNLTWLFGGGDSVGRGSRRICGRYWMQLFTSKCSSLNRSLRMTRPSEHCSSFKSRKTGIAGRSGSRDGNPQLARVRGPWVLLTREDARVGIYAGPAPVTVSLRLRLVGVSCV
uniref:Uncharacterized protein n=1 Tax=Nanning Botou tick virus 1 TaxID=2972041 RepID=A0A9E7V226_9VIRU|nr:MAG: hypothetical protein [Nanning Botou tick virus 1]